MVVEWTNAYDDGELLHKYSCVNPALDVHLEYHSNIM